MRCMQHGYLSEWIVPTPRQSYGSRNNADYSNLIVPAKKCDLFVWTHTHTHSPTPQCNPFEMIFPMKSIEPSRNNNPNSDKVIGQQSEHGDHFLPFRTNQFNWIWLECSFISIGVLPRCDCRTPPQHEAHSHTDKAKEDIRIELNGSSTDTCRWRWLRWWPTARATRRLAARSRPCARAQRIQMLAVSIRSIGLGCQTASACIFTKGKSVGLFYAIFGFDGRVTRRVCPQERLYGHLNRIRGQPIIWVIVWWHIWWESQFVRRGRVVFGPFKTLSKQPQCNRFLWWLKVICIISIVFCVLCWLGWATIYGTSWR